MRVILETVSHMVREIMKTFKKPTQENGEMILDMDWVNKNSKIEKEDILVHLYQINMKEGVSFMMRISFMMENLELDYLRVRV